MSNNTVLALTITGLIIAAIVFLYDFGHVAGTALAPGLTTPTRSTPATAPQR